MGRHRRTLLVLLSTVLLIGGLVGASSPVTSHSAVATSPATDSLAISTVATPVVGPGEPSTAARPVISRPNTTAVLSLDGPTERASYGTSGLDVAGALAVDGAEIQGRFAQLQVEHRFAAAETEADRRAAVRAATDRLEERVETLQLRDRRARETFAFGSLSTRAFLRRQAVVGGGGEELSGAITVLGQRADAVGADTTTTQRVAALRADLIGLQGPVRARLARALAGDTGQVRVYVETDGEGVTLATVISRDLDGQYVRSAHVPSARNETLPNQFAVGPEAPLDAAEARARELYPWAFENHRGYSVGLLAGGPSLRHAAVYPVTVNHRHGTVRQGDLVAYLDGGTTDAFREVQYVSIEAVPKRSLGRQAGEQLSLSVNVTRGGGPMEVRVTGPTGDPADAVIYANGDPVGTTGTDGRQWLVSPAGSVNVTAVDGDAKVTVTGTA